MNYFIEWPVWEDYLVAGRGVTLFVIPSGRRIKLVNVGNESALPTELARVNRPWGRDLRPLMEKLRRTNPREPIEETLDRRRIRALIGFMKQFGSLGQMKLARQPEKIGQRVFDDADRLEWALAHAENVDICLSLVKMLKDREWSGLRRFFTAWRHVYPERRIPLVSRPFSTPISIPLIASYSEAEIKAASQAELEPAARQLLKDLLDPNLKHATRTFDGKDSRFEFDALIQVIYWRVADFAGAPYLRRCIECRTIFFSTDARQKYCPPPQGMRESRCAKRYQMRQLRKSKNKGKRR